MAQRKQKQRPIELMGVLGCDKIPNFGRSEPDSTAVKHNFFPLFKTAIESRNIFLDLFGIKTKEYIYLKCYFKNNYYILICYFNVVVNVNVHIFVLDPFNDEYKTS